MKFPTLSKTLTGKLASLRLKKHRDEYGVFIAEGSKCVADTLGNFKLKYLLGTSEWLESHNVSSREREGVYSASIDSLKKISSLATTPEVIAVYYRPDRNLDLQMVREGLTLVLDDVQDPGNLGTIVRLADWFGVRQIVASPHSADIYNPKVVQATMGSISRVSVFYKDLTEFFLSVGRNMSISGLMLEGENIYSASLPRKGLIVMGNEGNGLSDAVRKMLTLKLFIPPYPQGASTAESLNVATATAITLSEFRRRME